MTNLHEIEKLLRSSTLVTGGFMGTDMRGHAEIIRADLAELGRLHCTTAQLADMLDALARVAGAAQGASVPVAPGIAVRADDIRGGLPCPWGDGQYGKGMVEAQFSDGRPAWHWSALSAHMIREHGFFQGRGSPFRLEPAALARLLDEQ